MDKNFINIDDLVRQRLGGGEEKERAGAWLQMRELLDKEMPQRRGGFIYWRRIFSAIAGLLLIASASIGSYMYATSISGNDASNNMANNNNENTSNISKTAINTNEINNTTQIATADIPKHNEHSNNQNIVSATTITTKQTAKALTASDHNTKHSAEHNNKLAEEGRNRQFLSRLMAANEREKQIASNELAATNSTSKNNNSTKQQIAATHRKAITKTGHQGIKTIAAAKANRNSRNKDLETNNSTLALNNSRVGTNFTKPKAVNSIRKAAAKNEPVNTSNLTLSDNTPTTKNIASVNVANILNKNDHKQNHGNKPGLDNKQSSASNLSVTSPGIASNTGKKPGLRNGHSSKSKAAAQSPDNNIITKEVAEVKMDKKVIDRLVMTEHFVKTAPNEGYYKLDTISFENLNEELGLNNEPNKNTVNSERKNSSKTPTTSTLAKNEEESSEVTQSNSNSPILPAATTTTATGKSGMGLKENQTSKGGSGLSTVEKLTSTFNDIKFQIAGAQFAPGLTAGINGTFFGPSSFKGFQFGVTGNFMFGETISILTELKYFHRINNNYTLNDNYYTYTPVGGGQYSKELQPVSYSFSTLHSFEMPISIHYCQSHFNFYAGGNLVYSFAINTGASTMSPNIYTPVLVSAPGNDNTPKIKADDFNSRFGLGYLFGISYQVSPNVLLDFRNVQTVWDNSSSQGGKIISNQLYKSPSLQVSVGYRLGGKKGKSIDK